MVQPRKAKAKILDGLSRLAKSAHDQGDNPLFQQLSSATAKFESTGAIDDELLRRAYPPDQRVMKRARKLYS